MSILKEKLFGQQNHSILRSNYLERVFCELAMPVAVANRVGRKSRITHDRFV